MSAHKIVKLLNEALVADPVAINALFRVYIPCNRKLAEHPTITIGMPIKHTGGGMVSIMGILNGLVGDPTIAVACECDLETRELRRFIVLKPSVLREGRAKRP